MARIPKSELERLKAATDLVALVESAGVTLKAHGADRIGLCPFHDDHEPSLVVTPAKNLWHCLGACQTGGTAIDWVMQSQGVSFRHAVELLQAGSALAAPTAGKKDKVATYSTKRHLAGDLDAELADAPLLARVVDFYHRTLKQSPEALKYLKSRGLDDPALIDTFKLGFANRTLGYRLPPKQVKAGAAIRNRLQELGVVRPSGHEHFNGSLVIPVLNESGEVVELYGRKITPNLRKGTPLHLYLPGPHAGVFNLDGLQDQTEVILCESLIDALTFWSAGYKNVTASFGVGGFTDEHLDAFKVCGVQRVLIAYDRDKAGNQAAAKLAKKLQAEGLGCYRVLFPKGMDANQYACEVQPARKSLGVVIRSAEWLGGGAAPARETISNKPEAVSVAAKEEKPGNNADDHPALAAENPSELLPAQAVPPTPVDAVEPQVSEHEVTLAFGPRRYRVRGLQKNTSYEVLKVNVLLQLDEAVHVDTFDLYSSKHRQAFAKLAAVECGVEEAVIQRDLGQLLLQLEGLQDNAIQEALKPTEPTAYTLDEDERARALELLRDPNLTRRIIDDFASAGLVGEPENALVGYLAAVSRKLAHPLAIIVQSTSAAGKSALMDAVLRFIPVEDRVQYSAMTGQSLFYLGETNLKHKVLGIAEEEGVRQAAYALKLLQSQGELTIASTGKDPQTGKLVTEEYRVEGPVMLFLTTTAIDLDEELLNRCVVLTINESREQTAAIQQRQRESRTLVGLLQSTSAEQLLTDHQNAQRLLKPLAVVNPYAEQLAFADRRTRTRRDHEKYLTLIDAIALLHQYQRELKTVRRDGQVLDYVEVTKADIALANRLAHEVLGRSLDELPPPTRKLLQQLRDYVNEQREREGVRAADVRFTRRELREAVGLSDTQVRVHLERLVSLEYVLVHHGRNGQRFVYELVFDGDTSADRPQLMGLIDVEDLTAPTTTPDLAVSNGDLAPSLRPACGADASASNTVATMAADDLPASLAAGAAVHVAGCTSVPSQRNGGSSALAADALAPQE